MHATKHYIGEIQKMVKRWEQQISKRRNAAPRSTAPAAEAGETQVSAAEPRPAASPDARGPSGPYSP